MQHVTIKDIAHLAGVPVITVSRALNIAPEIHSATREQVLRVCQKQGYLANLLARILSSNHSGLLGLVVPDMSNPFHAALALNLELCAQADRRRSSSASFSASRQTAFSSVVPAAALTPWLAAARGRFPAS